MSNVNPHGCEHLPPARKILRLFEEPGEQIAVVHIQDAEPARFFGWDVDGRNGRAGAMGRSIFA